jgi:hypothetical protein
MKLIALAAILSWVWTRQRSDMRSTIVVVLAVAGGLIFLDGFRLAVLEESRMRNGRVVSGIVEDLPTSAGSIWDASRVQSNDLHSYEGVCRFLRTLTRDEWIASYRYPCAGGTTTCRQSEYVTKHLWSQLQVGQPINVRQSVDETRTARLDSNPQRGLAVVKMALGWVPLAVAGLLSGYLTLFRRQKYIEADAVVTSVECVRYGDDVRWKVRFAYFDTKGNAQDSVDEVNNPSWKPGDACRAVYRPQTPDLATLRPRSDVRAPLASQPTASSVT